jgi:hypothetical protein
VAYLNRKGISNGVMFNFQGNGPAWLGSPALNTGMEPEWAQMVASLLIYARQTNQLQFGLVGPDNEMDQTSQGVNMTASQYVTALHDLSQLLDTNGMSDLQFVGPDLANISTTYMSQMMADPVVMSKLAHFGVHSYSDNGGGSAGVYSYIQGSAYPDRTFWVTEFNVWCSVCDFGQLGTYDWTYCKGTAEYLMQHLLNNASAGLVWEGYDSQYNYLSPLQWSFWGLFGVDDTNQWRQRGGQQWHVQRDDSGELRVHVDRFDRGQCRPHQSGQRGAIQRAGGDPAGRYGHDHGGQYCADLVLQRGDRAWRSHPCAVRVYVEQRADGQLCADRCRR